MEVILFELKQRIAGQAASDIVAVKVDCARGCIKGLEMALAFLQSHIVTINHGLGRLLDHDLEV